MDRLRAASWAAGALSAQNLRDAALFGALIDSEEFMQKAAGTVLPLFDACVFADLAQVKTWLSRNFSLYPHLKAAQRKDVLLAAYVLANRGTQRRPIGVANMFRVLDASVRANQTLAEWAVRQDPACFRSCSPTFRDHDAWALHCIAADGMLLGAASLRLQGEKLMAMAAVRQNGDALALLAPRFRGDREVVLAAVCSRGTALRFAAADRREDSNICYLAAKQDIMAFAFMGPTASDHNVPHFLDALSITPQLWPQLTYDARLHVRSYVRVLLTAV